MFNDEILGLFNLGDRTLEDWTAASIEKHRKGDGVLNVTDGDGKPVAGARISFRQVGSDFKIGANLFMLDEFSHQEQNDEYKRLFADCFNIATLPFYWSDIEPEQGKPRYDRDSPKLYRRPAPDLCLEYCEANGIMPKAHCLNYATFLPKWLKEADVATEKYYLEKRFEELAERYSGRIRDWEVTNETFFNFDSKSLFYRDPEFVEWSFKTAEKYFRCSNRLIINEAHCRVWGLENRYANRSPYFMQIERALAKGCRIDSIGMQFHMFLLRNEIEPIIKRLKYFDAGLLNETMDVYAALNIPQQITEVTIPAFSNNMEDEELQAEIIRRLYHIWFAHPAMEAIIYWNLVDGFAHAAPQGDMTSGENIYYGGFVRYDFTPKPAYYVVKKLLNETWRTNTQAETDADGKASFRGFYGDYEAIVTMPDGTQRTKKLHLAKTGRNNFTL